MATVKIKIENGFFIDVNGRYVESVEPTHVVANGWDCTIREDNSIECNAIREYSDGTHSIRYAIQKNGFAKLTLKKPGEKMKTLKKGFIVPKGVKLTLDGTLGLSGGEIDLRYAFFRDASFQRFLNEHDISAIKREDPNQTFRLRNALYAGGDCHSCILTDGTVHSLQFDSARSERFGSEEIVSVTGATWVLHKQSQHEGSRTDCFRILYTLKNPTSLVGIPNVTENREKAIQLEKVGSKGFPSLEKLEEALLLAHPNLKRKRYPHYSINSENIKYYAFVTLDKDTGEFSIEARSSSSEGNGFDAFYDDCWIGSFM